VDLEHDSEVKFVAKWYV